jgi:ABC-type transport system involved in multi-copper enzyme maturation permease subunit
LTMNLWMRVAGDTVLCLLLVQVTARAAGSISGERDQQTLDMLLTTPLGARNILFAKWLGSIVSTWRSWVWLGVIWVTGWYTGALSAGSIPSLVAAACVYVMAAASMAIWVSATCSTTSRALSNTFALILLIWWGHWAFFPLIEWLTDSPRWNLRWEWLWKLEVYALTPPLAFDYLASQSYVINENWNSTYATAHLEEFFEIRELCWLGLAFWFSVSAAFLCWAEVRFITAVGRRKQLSPKAPPRSEPPLTPALVLATKN